MQPARMMLCVAVVVVVTMTPQTQATFSVLPAVANIGGLAALKVLKFVGLSKLTEKVSDTGLEALTDQNDYSSDYYNQQPPIYVAQPPTYVAPSPTYVVPPPTYVAQQPAYVMQAPTYVSAPQEYAAQPQPYNPHSHSVPVSHPPAFYIVPAADFEAYKRSRRDLSKVTGPKGVVAVRSEEQYFDVIGGLDESGCVLRAVCEVAGVPLHKLTEDEKAIMAAFSAPYQPSSSAPTTLKGKYYEAVWVGRKASNATTTCAKMYSRCPVPARQLLKALEEEEHQEAGKVSRQ